MSEKSSRGCDPVRFLAGFVIASGLAGLLAGAVSWFTVRSEIAAERITVPEGRLAGRPVRGPVTAFAEGNAIRMAALEATGGRTYGELDSDDDAADTARQASLLRASLFTSVLAFGVSALLMASGLVLVAVGAALRSLTGRRRDPL